MAEEKYTGRHGELSLPDAPGPATGQWPLPQCFEREFLVLFPSNVRDIHADIVQRISCGPDQPVPGRHQPVSDSFNCSSSNSSSSL